MRHKYRTWQRDRFFRSAGLTRIFAAVMGRFAGPIYRWAAAEMNADIDNATTIADIGCGNGILARHLSGTLQGRTFLLVDASAAQLAAGSRNVARVGRHNEVRTIEAVAEQLPLPDGCADVVISTGSINLWSDPVRGLQECRRIVRPGRPIWIFDQAPVSSLGSGLHALARARVFGLGLPGYTAVEVAGFATQAGLGEPSSSVVFGSLFGFRWLRSSQPQE
jgi:SAM-dependent methyltransferase